MKFCLAFLISSCLLLNTGYSQVDTTQFRLPENYATASGYYLQQSSRNPSSGYYSYQAACYLSLTGAVDSAFAYINRAVDFGVRSEDIITDTDLKPLRADARWNVLMDGLKERYLKANPGITLPEQGVRLWLLGIEDQRFRTLSKNFKLPGGSQGMMVDGGRLLKEVEAIVRQYGWPTIAMVGEKASEAAFLIVQHASPSDIKRYLPMVVASAQKGEIKRKWAAMMIDRHLLRSYGVQLYGTQFGNSGKRNKSTGIVEWTPLKPEPIVDEENLAERRKSVGLDPIESDAKRFQVTYIPPSQREGYKPIKMKRKYLKSGYLF
ncbi:DUF6624 domain-containing protein [Williamwhitmania taraxaci]|uniref:Uncharacterized protein n=1 Tax=Williamwhitmania taraxaci TaxID=1640674 RepID=A0A1G6RZ90_9BACT|nr:DUF6624 domain-containing protein [Williamwhitmania taraxaci]SDD09970.1 hypothetical protein SAMN05216323_10849 [Williamwhitmania taraxaci]